MLKIHNPQLDVFTAEVYNHLVPKNHLLVRIADAVDFNFVLEKLKNRYSNIGRGSYDPIMMFKIQLLCYLYQLSDGKVIQRAQTDIAFRWFLGLNIYDALPDDTTVSYFRVHRLDNESLEDFFNEIVSLCIEKHVVTSRRVLIDSTNVDANTNYPSKRSLINEAYKKLMNKLMIINEHLATEFKLLYSNRIEPLYEHQDIVRTKEHAAVAKEIMELLYLKSFDLIEENQSYCEAYQLCHTLIQQGLGEITTNLVISTVDTDARVAHKSPGVLKKGYKDHILVDEDSEIILASTTTPFNVGDDKELENLVHKAKTLLETKNLKIQELSADTVYSTIRNREFLHDEQIKANIPFYKQRKKDVEKYGLDQFKFNEDLTEMICPAGHKSHKRSEEKSTKTNEIDWRYSYDVKLCRFCPMKESCVQLNKNGNLSKGKTFVVPSCFKMIEDNKKYNETQQFKEANNKRYIVERRFATLVRNHMLRRSRFLKIGGATKHNLFANMACNLVRLVNLLTSSNGHEYEKSIMV